MRFEAGYLHVGALDGAPIRLHWSLPLGAFVLGAGAWAPVFWLGYAIVVLVHEIGHIVMVRRVGGEVDAIELTGWGGHCEWSGYATRFDDALVAAGGIIAQTGLFVIVTLPFFALGEPEPSIVLELMQSIATVNLLLAVVNLIPLPPLDGVSAWRLLPYAITYLHQRYGVDELPPPARREAAPRRSDAAKVVRLHDRLDRELDRILRSSTRARAEDDSNGSD